MTQRELRRLKRDASIDRGLTPEDIAKRVEDCTAHYPFPVTVTDVRYSPADDTYKVSYRYVDAAAYKEFYGKTVPAGGVSPETVANASYIFRGSNFVLESDGYGTYSGPITNASFLAPLDNKESSWVTSKTPSPLRRHR